MVWSEKPVQFRLLRKTAFRNLAGKRDRVRDFLLVGMPAAKYQECAKAGVLFNENLDAKRLKHFACLLCRVTPAALEVSRAAFLTLVFPFFEERKHFGVCCSSVNAANEEKQVAIRNVRVLFKVVD